MVDVNYNMIYQNFPETVSLNEPPKEYGNTPEEDFNNITPTKSGNINDYNSPSKIRIIIENILIIFIFIINFIPFPLIITEVVLRYINGFKMRYDYVVEIIFYFIIIICFIYFYLTNKEPMTSFGNVIFYIFAITSINLAVLVVIDIKDYFYIKDYLSYLNGFTETFAKIRIKSTFVIGCIDTFFIFFKPCIFGYCYCCC